MISAAVIKPNNFKGANKTIPGEKNEKTEKRDALDKRQEVFKKQVLEGAKALSRKRQAVSAELQAAVETELRQLHMGETVFRVRFQEEREPGSEKKRDTARVHRDGFDRLEFMICPNVGEELRPLAKIASGGELSRIMLALKTLGKDTEFDKTLIFDEIDSGIGGKTAEFVAQKLQDLSMENQVICITHLPQIASFATHHFKIEKTIKNNRTFTTVKKLSFDERIEEIARLSTGSHITQAALQNAKEMLLHNLHLNEREKNG